MEFNEKITKLDNNKFHVNSFNVYRTVTCGKKTEKTNEDNRQIFTTFVYDLANENRIIWTVSS